MEEVCTTFNNSIETESTCRREWMRLGGSCYQFGKEMISWQDVAGICKLNKGYLAEINLAEENTLIVNQIRTIHASLYNHVSPHLMGNSNMLTEVGCC
ncbi:hypothetical protein BsWGS_24798 [Bradybaena similaris]